MRTFIAVTGTVFALIVVAHIVRIAVEGFGLLRDPIFVLASAAALGAAIWSFVLLRSGRPD